MTIKNYRCFVADAPVVIEIREGFTALVGPNNSGKSSMLKFFHELKHFWEKFRNTNQEILTVLKGGMIGINYNEVIDPEELLCDASTGDLEFVLEILDIDPKQSDIPVIHGIRGIAQRSQPVNWKFEFLYGQKLKKAVVPPDRLGKLQSLGKNQLGRLIVKASDVSFDFSDFCDVMDHLSNILFVPAFRNAINEGAAAYYGMLVGTSFVQAWHSWKAGLNKAQSRAMAQATEDIRAVFEFDTLEINAAEKGNTLAVWINGRQYRLAELGSGLAQFILIFGNAAIKRPSIILIDEPETNLHPSLQIAFLTALARYSEGNIVFATHSIGLARSTAEIIYSFRRGQAEFPSVRLFEQTPNYAEFVGEMSFAAYKELGCNSILLVEGVTDVKTFQQFLRKLKVDAKVVAIPLGGDAMARGGVEHELEEIKRITPDVYAIVDSERTGKDKPPIKARSDFKKSCEGLQIKVHLTDRRATENYFTEHAIKEVLGDKYSSLGHYDSLKTAPNSWNKSQDNWRIASRMTRQDIENTDVGQFLLEVLGPPDSTI